MLAVSSGETIYIFALEQGEWRHVTELHQHDLHVTGLDWAPKSNRLVSGSHDKNAFVFTIGPDNTFKPELVLVRTVRGISSVKWSPFGELIFRSLLRCRRSSHEKAQLHPFVDPN